MAIVNDIGTLINDLAEAQKKLLKTPRYPLDFDRTREDHKKEDDRLSEYEVVDNTLHEELMKAYKNIFPDYYDKLEDVRKEVDVCFSP